MYPPLSYSLFSECFFYFLFLFLHIEKEESEQNEKEPGGSLKHSTWNIL